MKPSVKPNHPMTDRPDRVHSILLLEPRSGDLDPSLASYLSETERMTTEQFFQMVNHRSGLFGVSEASSGMGDLMGHEAQDIRAAEAVVLFCF